MNTKNIVYILGAGSSKPDGIPLMKEFISEGAIRLGNVDRFFDFVKSAFPGQFTGKDKDIIAHYLDGAVGIEEVLDKAITTDSKAEDVVKEFIFNTIQEFDSSSKRVFFKKFVQNKIESNIKEGDIITIISFNYDQLLERALMNKCLSKSFSYRIPKSFEIKLRNFDYERNYNKTLNILKLHGALNWLLCNRCRSIELSWYKDYDKKGSCGSCKTELTPILVPPIKDKSPIFQNYDNLFGPLWKEAEDALRNASEIIVAGYSLREEDDKARKTIGSGIANNFDAKLTIVDTNSDRIRGVLSEISGKEMANFTSFCSFEEFVNGSEAKKVLKEFFV